MVKILMLVLAERHRRGSGWRTAVRATHVVVGRLSLYLLALIEARLSMPWWIEGIGLAHGPSSLLPAAQPRTQ